MVDFSDFFPAGTRESEPLLGSGFILFGPRSTGKSSFAFQAAVNVVLRGGSVIVLCHETCIYRKVPRPFTPLSSLSAEELQRLEFAYVSDWTAALEHLMEMDAQAESCGLPDLVLLEDDSFPSDPRSPLLAAHCASYAEGVAARLSGGGAQRFYYILVLNAAEPGPAGRLELPLSALPAVQVRFTLSGVVHVAPVAGDAGASNQRQRVMGAESRPSLRRAAACCMLPLLTHISE
eukprot:gene9460-6642_t